MDLELNGKVVLVGGSSRGIGLAIAEAFLREGASVVVTGRDGDSLRAADDRLAGDVLVWQGDTGAGAAEVVAAARERFGRLDVVVANVGSGRGTLGVDAPLEEWRSLFDVNLFGSIALAQAAAPLLRQSRGAIVFVASIAGLESIGAPLAYEAAKAALIHAAKGLARGLAPDVRVNVVAPGNVLFPGGRWEEIRAEQPETVERMLAEQVPLQRFGTPADIADAVLFLGSKRAGFVTGACLVVDGGQLR